MKNTVKNYCTSCYLYSSSNYYYALWRAMVSATLRLARILREDRSWITPANPAL
uniref:Uncharacterized protein n=1 Tax=Papilio polytes TaxID=76194 RepID=I4DN58_PAPPL|nr:unknown unsecreted protein [Papilio polytes]